MICQTWPFCMAVLDRQRVNREQKKHKMAVSKIQSSLQAWNAICSHPFQFARFDLCQTTTCQFSHRRWWIKKLAGEFITSSISTECLECYHVFATIFHRAARGLFFSPGGSKWVLPIIIPIKSNKDLTKFRT